MKYHDDDLLETQVPMMSVRVGWVDYRGGGWKRKMTWKTDPGPGSGSGP